MVFQGFLSHLYSGPQPGPAAHTVGWSSCYSWDNRDNSLKTCPEACLPGDFRLCHRQWVLGKKWLSQVSAHTYTHLCVQYTGTRVLWRIRNLCLEPTSYSSVFVPHEPGFCLQPMVTCSCSLTCPGPGLQYKPISHPVLLNPLSGILPGQWQLLWWLWSSVPRKYPWAMSVSAWCWAASSFSVIKQQCCAPQLQDSGQALWERLWNGRPWGPTFYSRQIFFLSRWWLLVLLVYSGSLF